MKHLRAVSVPAVLALVVIVSVACEGPAPHAAASAGVDHAAGDTGFATKPSPTPTVAPTLS